MGLSNITRAKQSSATASLTTSHSRGLQEPTQWLIWGVGEALRCNSGRFQNRKCKPTQHHTPHMVDG